jgi:HD-GYP domain-containing protein (c-di-GMP phosphodiesterase class II)
MPELDMVMFSILKEVKNSIHCAGISIWLLGEEENRLECMYAVGSDAPNMLGRFMRAKKFTVLYRYTASRQITFEDIPYSKWMDRQGCEDYFKSENELIVFPLVARRELIGMMAIAHPAGAGALGAEARALVHQILVDIAVAIQNTQLYEQRNRSYKRQKLLNQISRHLHQTLNLDELIPNIFAEINQAIHVEAQSIWLVDQAEKVIKCRYSTGTEFGILKGFSVPLNTASIVGTSVIKKKSLIVRDAHRDPRHARSADEQTGFVTRSIMTVPLVLEEEAIGAIQAVNKRGGELFTQEDLDLFSAIAYTAALAVSNAQLVTELQNSYDLTLEALSAALDLRDRETEGHSRRVVEYTARLAVQIGLDKDVLKSIRRGALIHDIGKIGVPDAILHKPAALDAEERRVIERHPQLGYNMLVGIPYLREEIQIVVCHQEKWDGTGYPFGLRGEEIAIGARLFAIADTFDALTSDRPYRKGRSYEAARKLIEEESGKQFDPQAVAAFLAVPAEEWEQIRARVMEEIKQRRDLKQ